MVSTGLRAGRRSLGSLATASYRSLAGRVGTSTCESSCMTTSSSAGACCSSVASRPPPSSSWLLSRQIASLRSNEANKALANSISSTPIDKSSLSANPSRVSALKSSEFCLIGPSPRSSASAAGAPRVHDQGHDRWQPGNGGLEEWLRDLRIAANGNGLTHKALLVDAAGTLVEPAQSVAQVYLDIGKKYGVTLSEDEILWRYRMAYSEPWMASPIRYVADARPFWRFIVAKSTGCSNEAYFEEVYNFYARKEAWRLCDEKAGDVFAALRSAGVKVAVVSNFDTRLRALLKDLECDAWFDTVAVSAEVEAEKPNPVIFWHALEQLGVKDPSSAVHVGDDRRNDVWGARDAGCDAWLWNSDVFSFDEVAQRIGVEVAR